MDEYLIYLRKSRQDRDAELETGVYDTLERHRKTLLALADRMHLTISHIYEEVVTGDTIAERPEMQKLLAAVETCQYAGVLVMEIPRLARGNTRDQGVVSETFQYAGTKIITPDKIYDPSSESDEEYLEFGLFMSRREYKTINRRLNRGRMASLNEGKYIAGAAPYGYEKYKLQHQKGYSLRIVPEQAEVVRRIFRMYTGGTEAQMGSSLIAQKLNAESITAPGGGDWSAYSVRYILKNPVYAGYIRWSHRPVKKRVIDGVVTTSCPVSADAKIVKGLHDPIIDEVTWKRACTLMTTRGAIVPTTNAHTIQSPLAGVVYCQKCGRSMVRLPHGAHGSPTLRCPNEDCDTMMSRLDVVEDALLDGLQRWLKDYEMTADETALCEAPDLALKEAEKTAARLRASMKTIEQQRDRLYDLLEQGVYDQDTFTSRSRKLAAQSKETQIMLDAAITKANALRNIVDDRMTLIPKIHYVLDNYRTTQSAAEKNALLKQVLERVNYSKTTGGRGKPSDMQLFLFPRLHHTE